MSSDLTQRRLTRAQKKIETLERMIEDKTRELFEANETLQASNVFMSDVLRSMAGALVVTDAQKNIELTNSRLNSLLGYAESELLEKSVRTILPQAGNFRAADHDRILEEETVCIDKAGRKIPILLTTSRVRSEDVDRGYIYVAIDIRDRKVAQAELRETQHQLVVASRLAGMAEVATGVLHNVGNVLNSVNVSANIILEGIEGSKAGALRKLSDLVAQHESRLGDFFSTDPKGKKIPAFLKGLANHAEHNTAALSDETRALIKNIDHIKTIVASQQCVARPLGAKESLKLPDVVEAALDMHEDSLARSGIRVDRVYGDVPAVSMDRHKLMQVVINFLSNAIQSMEAVRGKEHVLTIEIAKSGSDRIHLRVRDTGLGIDAEHLSKIFAHGFTTKKEGHGFGLHSSANAAAEMGGRVYAESLGLGEGATFTLELPANGAQKNEAA